VIRPALLANLSTAAGASLRISFSHRHRTGNPTTATDHPRLVGNTDDTDNGTVRGRGRGFGEHGGVCSTARRESQLAQNMCGPALIERGGITLSSWRTR
jgi:hypothetical protein